MMPAGPRALDPLFQPEVVAVIGASRTRGGIGSEIFHNIQSAGYRGRVIPVNRGAAVVDGVPAYPSVSAIPVHVDLAVIAVPCDVVEAVVDECIAARVGALLVISAGFSETGESGRARQVALLGKVRAAGIRMVGPNCMGVINTDPAVRLNATFAPIYPPEGRLALSTQSGALGLAILDYASRLNIGFSTFVSVGNKADVSGNDLIEYWRDDPRTDAILLYLESFGNPRRFGELAREVGRRKPIVAVKAGRSRAGARAAASHTGALASSDAVVDALFKQSGVIRTGTIEELFDVAALVAHQPIPRGPRVAILTNAGGPGIMAADACEGHGLELPALGEKTLASLREFLPAAASLRNPVDMLASAPAAHYERAIRLLLEDEGIDSLLVIFIPPLVTEADAVASAIVAGVRGTSGKPVLASFTSAHGAPPALGHVPCYVFPESAALALARVVSHGAWLRKPIGVIPEPAGVNPDLARVVMDRAIITSSGWLLPQDVQQLLGAVGIQCAPVEVVPDEDGAVRAGRRFGFPVVVKAIGPEIVHKTELGGVALGLVDDEAVRVACGDMRQRLGHRLTGFVVQPMMTGGIDMLVGVAYDQTFGAVVACATGGTLAELFADVALRLPPLTDIDAADMVNDLRGAALLRGYRGAPAVDGAALADTVLRVSALSGICPEIRELDINPLRVLPRGVCALDARVRIERPPVPGG
ncbi:MAG: acetate--CoA ligase family protein [Vicinamibacterales bacterium]